MDNGGGCLAATTYFAMVSNYLSYCEMEILKNLLSYNNQNQIKKLLLINSNQATMAGFIKLQNILKLAAYGQ